MVEIIVDQEITPPPDWASAKEALDKAVAELSQVSQGTSLQFALPTQMLIMQLDVAIDMLANQGVLSRAEFFNRIREAVQTMTSDVRRAILASGAQ